MIDREERVAYILGQLEAASDRKIEEYYWFFQCEEEEA